MRKYTKVRNYTTKQILDKIKSLPTFRGFPAGKSIVGARSIENYKNVNDDKFYLLDNFGDTTKDPICYEVLTGTTQSGSHGFTNWYKWSKEGYAEIKANECYYDVWKGGYHNSKMMALKQYGDFKVIRKKYFGDPNTKWKWESNKGLNFHTQSYNKLKKVVSWFIGGWSTGCQSPNNVQDYYKIIKPLYEQDTVTYFLLDEWNV